MISSSLVKRFWVCSKKVWYELTQIFISHLQIIMHWIDVLFYPLLSVWINLKRVQNLHILSQFFVNFSSKSRGNSSQEDIIHPVHLETNFLALQCLPALLQWLVDIYDSKIFDKVVKIFKYPLPVYFQISQMLTLLSPAFKNVISLHESEQWEDNYISFLKLNHSWFLLLTQSIRVQELKMFQKKRTSWFQNS